MRAVEGNLGHPLQYWGEGVEGGDKEAERQGTQVAPVLPERAPSEGPRSTAAIGATWVPCQ